MYHGIANKILCDSKQHSQFLTLPFLNGLMINLFIIISKMIFKHKDVFLSFLDDTKNNEEKN